MRPSGRPSGHGPHAVGLFALTLVAVPFVVLLVDLLRQPAVPVYLVADFGLIELATREAARGVRLLGAWSRFGWNHPGPAYFYLLAPFYTAAGARSLGLYAGVITLNAAAALMVVVVVARRAGTWAGLCTAVVLLVFMWAVGPLALRDLWNPSVVVLPTLTLVVLCAAAAAGSGWSLGAAAIVATFVAQTHISTAPFGLIALGVATLARHGCVRRRASSPADETARRSGQRWGRVGAGLVATIIVLLWLPPLVEQATAPSGNLSELVSFALTPRAGHGLTESARAFAIGATSLPFGLSGHDPPHTLPALDAGRVSVLVLFVGAAVVGVVGGLRRGDRFVTALGVAALAGGVVCVALATQVAGPLVGYLMHWMVAIPLAALIGVAVLVSHVVRPREMAVVMVAGAVAAGGVAVAVRGVPPVASASDLRVARIVDEAGERGLLRADRPLLVRTASRGHGEWIVVTGLVAALDRLGIDVRVPDQSLAHFSPRQRWTGDERTALVIGEVGQPLNPDALAGTWPLVTVGDTAVFVRRVQG